MADKADTIGVPGYEVATAGNYPPFKGPDEAGLRATPTLAELQALDSRGVAKGRAADRKHVSATCLFQ